MKELGALFVVLGRRGNLSAVGESVVSWWANSLHVIRTLRALGLPRVSAEDFYRNPTLTELVALVRRVRPSR